MSFVNSMVPFDDAFSISCARLNAETALAHFRLRLLLRSRVTSPLEIEEITLELLARLLESGPRQRGGQRTQPWNAPSVRAHRDLVEGVRRFLAEHYSGKLLLADIGHAVGASPFHLSRIFTRETGSPIHRYLILIRLQAALDRIADGDMDLSRLALEVGFSSHSHFTTAFGREYGSAPTALLRTLV